MKTIYTVLEATTNGPRYRLGTRNDDGTMDYINGHLYDTIEEADEAAERLREQRQRERQEQEDLIFDAFDQQDGLMDSQPVLPPVIPYGYRALAPMEVFG